MRLPTSIEQMVELRSKAAKKKKKKERQKKKKKNAQGTKFMVG